MERSPSLVLFQFALYTVLTLGFTPSGCGSDSSSNNGNPGTGNMPACNADSECASGLECLENSCKPPAEFNCMADGCPANLTCMPTGLCQADVACIVDTDCCTDGTVCELQCVNYQCEGNQCTTGDTKECYVGCHRGEKACVNGIWADCDASPVTETEICDDGIDNDCDGTTDLPCPDCTPGNVRPCDTACGAGTQDCGDNSKWEECDAPIDCLCEPGDISTQTCDKCGFVELICIDDGVWSDSDICLSQGACEAGEIEEQDCGSCGTQTRTCDDACAWGEWGSCESGGDCTPGDTEQQSCGSCGSQLRECESDCTWSDWDSCEEGTGCQLGETQQQSCGFCGIKQKMCQTACGAWPDDWGPCMGEGTCEPGEVETEACGMCGSKQRTCSSGCTWQSWESCGGQGVCSPGDLDEQACGPSSALGACVQGTQARGCSASCQWNPWSSCAGATYPEAEQCADGIDQDCDGSDLTYPDDYEPNNMCAQCAWLADEDGEDIDMTIFGSFDSPNDTDDYYCFYGKDNGGLSWWENIKVTLSDQPLGVDGDLYLYKGEANCIANDPLAQTYVVGPDDEELEWGEDSGDDDSGIYIVRVQNWGEPSCFGEYELRINGLK